MKPRMTTTVYTVKPACNGTRSFRYIFFSVFTGFRFTQGCVLIKQSTKNMIA